MNVADYVYDTIVLRGEEYGSVSEDDIIEEAAQNVRHALECWVGLGMLARRRHGLRKCKAVFSASLARERQSLEPAKQAGAGAARLDQPLAGWASGPRGTAALQQGSTALVYQGTPSQQPLCGSTMFAE